MSELDEIKSILVEIRNGQKKSIEEQEKQVALAREQLNRARTQVDESLALQRESVAKQKLIIRVALPAIGLCIVAIIYLIGRYF